MTYCPVSLNVVLQALRHMTLPKPLQITPSKFVLSSEIGTTIGQVTLVFDRPQLHKHIRALGLDDVTPRTDAIKQAVQECFCEDIQVLRASYVPNESIVIVDLLCSVTAHD